MRKLSLRSAGARVYDVVAPSTRTTTRRVQPSTYATELPSSDHFVLVIVLGVVVFATERRRELSAFASQSRWSPFGSARQYARRPVAERSVTAGRDALVTADGEGEAAPSEPAGVAV